MLVQIFAKQAKIRVSEIFAILFIFAVSESGTRGLANSTAERMFTERGGNLSSLLQGGEKSSLVPRTFVETIASALGLAPPFGLCVCADVALRFPGWLER